MDRRANERAELLYGEIDRNKLFRGTAVQEDRSRMNICRSVGGFRASCYNAMPLSSVQALVECMQEFERKH